MWDLLPSDNQRLVVDSVREYLAGELPIERLRPGAAPSDPAAAHAGMAKLGWFAIGLPETVGGVGLGLVEEMLIQRECGRHLVSPSVMTTVLAGHVAVAAGDDGLARDVAKGSLRAALAIDAGPDTVLVFDWDEAGPVLHWTEEGMGLFAAEPHSAEPCLDDSLTLHTARLGEPRLWVPAGDAPLALRAQVLLAAAMVGLAERACVLAVAYAKLREQFGKPIGGFQAIKHRCADMAVRHRLAWHQTSLACLKLTADAPDALLQIASAMLLAAEAARENGRAVIQVHGGIGFQAECDAHWFLKRAHVYDQAGGGMAEHARRVLAAPAPGW